MSEEKRKTPITMIEAECSYVKQKKDGTLKAKPKKCLIVANEPDNSIVISLRDTAGVVIKVRFDTMTAAIANEIVRVKETEEKPKDEETSNAERGNA